MHFGNFKTVRHFTFAILLAAAILSTSGCNHLPRGNAPKMNAVFDRFDEIKISQSTSTDVLPIIQDKSMGELLSQDEQTIVSWGQNGAGAVIWLNAVSFDDADNTAARKYAILIDEDSPGWRTFYGAKSYKLRAEFEFILPPEFDELEFTNENEKRREALKTALSLYLKDINIVRYDSDYIYTTAMMLRQTINDILYQLERVPANLTLIDQQKGLDFTHPTMGKGKIRMIINNETYAVRLKIKIGSAVSHFATDPDVIAMNSFGSFADDSGIRTKAAQTKTRQEMTIWDLLGTTSKPSSSSSVKPSEKTVKPSGKKLRTPEELRQIEEMAQKQADAEIAEMKKQANDAAKESKPAEEQKTPAVEEKANEPAPADTENKVENPVEPQTPASTEPME